MSAGRLQLFDKRASLRDKASRVLIRLSEGHELRLREFGTKQAAWVKVLRGPDLATEDAVAKLEAQLGRLEREEGFKLVWYRTGSKPVQSNLLPYVVEVVAADKPGILYQLADFFDRQGITIESLHSSRYRAMQTGAEMFTAQVTIGIPANMHIAALRDDFMEFCDHLNLDAIMDPMKF